MREFTGRTAVVTGAASGIGYGIARAFARAGMRVALLDIQEAALERVRAEIEGEGGTAVALVADVSDPGSLAAAARGAQQAFGAIHVAVNNAGVAMHGTPLEELALEDWHWVIGVNLYGVIHGIRTFVPMIRGQGEGGYVVNTASIGGLQVRPGWNTGAYSMTKYAVVALSEALEQELEGSGIGVSVLCPAAVRTAIYDSAKNRPRRLGGAFERSEHRFLKDTLADGLAPLEVGQRLLRAMRDGEFFVFTHSEPRRWIEARHARILAAFDRIAELEEEHHAKPAR